MTITDLPDGMATSDVRTVLAMLLLDGKAPSISAVSARSGD